MGDDPRVTVTFPTHGFDVEVMRAELLSVVNLPPVLDSKMQGNECEIGRGAAFRMHGMFTYATYYRLHLDTWNQDFILLSCRVPRWCDV